MPTPHHHFSRPLSLSVVLACGALVLATLPARAHSQAACKIEALYACQDMQGKHGICVQYAVQLCANHSHAINNLPYQSTNSGQVGPRRHHKLVAPHGPRRALSAPYRGGPGMTLRMGSFGRIAR